MNFLFPLMAAVLQGSAHTLDKVILSFRKIGFKSYLGISAPFIAFVSLVIFLIFRSSLTLQNFANYSWALVILLIGIGIVNNITFYRALHEDKLSELETFDLLRNIPIIVFSSIFFSDERNPLIIILALIACSSVIWSHFERHHLKIASHSIGYIAWIMLAAPIEHGIFKILLFTWDPVSLYFVRWAVIGFCLGTAFRRYTKKAGKKAAILIFITSALSTASWMLFYHSYKTVGIVFTILLFSLQPLLACLASVFLLKEKLHWKKAVAFVIILAAIVPAQLFGKTKNIKPPDIKNITEITAASALNP